MGYYCNKCDDDISPDEYYYSMEYFDRALCIECQNKIRKKKYNGNSKGKATYHARKLYEALLKEGIKCQLEYFDGFKTVDIAILWADLYVEVDGNHHYYNDKQMESDYYRDGFSKEDGFKTIRVDNDEIEDNVKKVAKRIAKKARKSYYR